MSKKKLSDSLPTYVMRQDVGHIWLRSLCGLGHDVVDDLGEQLLVPLGVALNALHQPPHALGLGKLQRSTPCGWVQWQTCVGAWANCSAACPQSPRICLPHHVSVVELHHERPSLTIGNLLLRAENGESLREMEGRAGETGERRAGAARGSGAENGASERRG